MDQLERASLKERLENLVDRIDEIGVQEKSILSQLTQINQDATTLFQATRVVRRELDTLSQEITLPLPAAPTAAVLEVHEPAPVHTAENPTTKGEEHDFNESFLVLPLYQHSDNKSGSWELTLGVKWFSRIGIVALLIGLAMALNYTFPLLSAGAKISLGWLFSIGLFFLGGKLYSRLTILGRILQGGGLSLGYLCMYAMFFLPNVQLFHANSVGWICLGAYVALIMLVSQRLASQAVGLLSLLFGYYTASYVGYNAVLGPLTMPNQFIAIVAVARYSQLAFVSTTFLSVAAVVMAWKHPRWKWVGKAGLAGTLWTYLFWKALPFGQTVTVADVTPDQVFLALNCALFYLSSLIHQEREDLSLCVAATFGYYFVQRATPALWSAHGHLEMALALIQFMALGLVATYRKNTLSKPMADTLLILEMSFLGLATLQVFHGLMVPATLAAEALLFGWLSRKTAFTSILRISAGILWGLAWLSLLAPLLQHASQNYSLLATIGWVTLIALAMERWNLVTEDKSMGMAIMVLGLFLLFLGYTGVIPSHWQTVSFFTTGALFLTLGFIGALKKYRWIGLCWIGLAFLHLIFRDIAMLTTLHKIVLFIVLGVGLLGASYGYSLLERKIVQKTDPD